MTTHHQLPDLSLTQALWAVRAGGRGLGWLNRLARLHPGLCAVPLWIWWAWLMAGARTMAMASPVDRVVGAACEGAGLAVRCMPTNDGSGVVLFQDTYTTQPIAGVAFELATWVWAVAMFLTLGAVILFLTGLTSEPTHRLGPDGRLRRVKGHTSRRRRRDARYVRLRLRRTALWKDWKASKRDEREVNKALARLGRMRRDRRDRRWALEDANNAERTPVRPLDALLIKRAEPKKGRKAAKRKKAPKRQRAALDAEWQREVTGIRARQAAAAVALAAPAPRAGVDAAVPPLAPGSTAGTSAQQLEYVARATRAHDDAVAFVAELQGLAPGTPGSEP